jgi:outer membrane protein OmpA-like peptidoglycan-associated protein
LRIVPKLALALSLAAPAAAQAPGVAVDYGALDSSAPPAAAPGDAAPIMLKPPLPPVVLTPPPPAKREVMVVPPPRPPVTPTVTPVRAPAPMPRAAPVPLTPPLAAPQPTPAAAPATVAGPAEMVHFAKADTALTPDGRALLDRVAATLAADDKLRLELLAHASGDPDDPVMARRVALQRAIVLRTYLIEHGVQSVRMDVRALGDKDAGDGPLDRVDLVLVGR